MDYGCLYTPLQRWQTRVLRLHPANKSDNILCADLVRAGLADGPHLALSMDEPLITFEAISYTWGKKTGFQDDIICNGQLVKIFPSLGGALRQFRFPDRPRYLWADALCIHQSDNAEKSIQVANMFTIFRKAETDLVWLGKQHPHWEAAKAYFDSWVRINKDDLYDGLSPSGHEAFIGGLLPELRHALEDLCLRPWNRRAWIQQEVFAAHNIEVFCGAHTFTFEDYRTTLENILKTLPLHGAGKRDLDSASEQWYKVYNAVRHLSMATETALAGLHRAKEIHELDEYRYLRFGSTRVDGDRPPFEELMYVARDIEATDPRDYVYALLNLTSCPIFVNTGAQNRYEIGQLGISIDYSLSLSEVLQDVTRFIMNSDESIAVLAYHEIRGNRKSSVDGLPSWVIDWRTQKRTYEDTPLYTKYSRERCWVWQSPNAEGTITVGCTLLAVVQSMTSSAKHAIENMRPHTSTIRTSLEMSNSPYTVTINAYSYISHRLLTDEQKTGEGKGSRPSLPFGFYWVEEGYQTSYRRRMHHEASLERYIEYECLQNIRPGDILVHIDGIAIRLVYLRPAANPKHFTFVMMVNLGAHLELIVGPRHPDSPLKTENLYQSSNISGAPDSGYPVDGAFDDLLLCETKLHQDFVIC